MLAALTTATTPTPKPPRMPRGRIEMTDATEDPAHLKIDSTVFTTSRESPT
jgi:hypothetical protein